MQAGGGAKGTRVDVCDSSSSTSTSQGVCAPCVYLSVWLHVCLCLFVCVSGCLSGGLSVEGWEEEEEEEEEEEKALTSDMITRHIFIARRGRPAATQRG